MIGDVYIGEKNRLWVEIELDTICLENSYDISDEYNLPPMCIIDSGDSEFIDIEDEEFMSTLTKIGTNYELLEVSDGFTLHYVYCNMDKTKQYLYEESKKCQTLEDLLKYFKKYRTILLNLK